MAEETAGDSRHATGTAMIRTLFILSLCLVGVGCHQIIHRPPIETDRRKAEVETMRAQATMYQAWSACMWEFQDQSKCGPNPPLAVTTQRAPDTKSMVGVELPSITQVLTGGTSQ